MKTILKTIGFLKTPESRAKRTYFRFMAEESAPIEDHGRPIVLTVKGAAAELSCSETHVRRLIQDGDLPAIRLGDGPRSPYRVLSAGLEAYVARRLDCEVRARPLRANAKVSKRSGSSASWAWNRSSESPRREGLDG